jgi:hypothetical protein
MALMGNLLAVTTTSFKSFALSCCACKWLLIITAATIKIFFFIFLKNFFVTAFEKLKKIENKRMPSSLNLHAFHPKALNDC